MLKKLIFLTLLTLSTPSVAERWFDVEVIVFKRDLNSDSVNEKWPDAQPEINISNAISLSSDLSLKKYGMSLIAKKNLKLKDEYKRLDRHRSFTPLIHVGWRQNDGSRNEMPKIRFKAGTNYQADFYTDGSPKNIEYFTETSLTNEAQSPKINAPIYEFDGYIRLYVQHYLFFETNLVLRESIEQKVLKQLPVNAEKNTEEKGDYSMSEELSSISQFNPSPEADNTETRPRTFAIERYLRPYSLKQKRRMKSGEMHYIDHPKIGVLIQVTRVN